jgi:hypothetical protein
MAFNLKPALAGKKIPNSFYLLTTITGSRKRYRFIFLNNLKWQRNREN